MARIIFGIVITLFGFFMVWKTFGVQEFLGTSAWAEEHMGPGSSSSFYKLIGAGLCVLGILTITGIINGIIESVMRIFIRPLP